MPKLPVYQIRDWNIHFENNRSRELKTLDWVPLPNKHDGDGFTDLISEPDGVTLFGAWVLILQLASKCSPRGTLLRKVGTIPHEGATTPQTAQKQAPHEGATTLIPHDFASISRITRCPEKMVENAIRKCLEIGWIEVVYKECRHNPAPDCDLVPSSRARAEGNRIEGNRSTEGMDKEKPEQPEKGGIWEFKKRVGAIFQRKDTDHWKQPEELELVQVFKRPEAFNELQIVENAYGRGLKYLPQSVGRLLEDWTGTLDKARNPERQQDNAGGKRPESRQRVEGLTARVVDFTKQEKQQ
jgi:hypothetical protein